MSESENLALSPPIPEITREEIAARLRDAHLTIVNVLPRASWEEARILGSVNLPIGEVLERAPETLPDRNQEIAVYCASPT